MHLLRQILTSCVLLASVLSVLADDAGSAAAARQETAQTDLVSSPRGYSRASASLAAPLDEGQHRPGDLGPADLQVQNAVSRVPAAPRPPSSPTGPFLIEAPPSELAYSLRAAGLQTFPYKLFAYPAGNAFGTGDAVARVDSPFEQPGVRESRSVGPQQQLMSMRTSGGGLADEGSSEQHVITKRSSYTAPYFVGKRSLDDQDPFRENETHEDADSEEEERAMEGAEEAEDPEDKRARPMFVGKRPWAALTSDDKRGAPLFVGKRKAPFFIGKRPTPMFVGKRRTPMFVGKRRTPMFVGKKASPWFVGKRRTPLFVGKRARPMFVGKRSTPLFVGKREVPMFVGRGSPMFVGRRGSPMFVGRRGSPMFVGKRGSPMFVGRRASPMFVGKKDNLALDRNPEITVAAGGHDLPGFVGRNEDAFAESRPYSPPVIEDEPDDASREEEEEDEEQGGQEEKRRTAPLLVGKRQEEDIGQLLATLQTLQAARNYRRMIQADKRYNAPFFIGRRDSQQVADSSPEGPAADKDGVFLR